MPESSGKEITLSSVLRDWSEINFTGVLLILVVAWIAIVLVQRALPWIGKILPRRSRGYVAPWIPLLRLAILLVALAQLVPMFIKPTEGNLFALIGSAALAIGFAFKSFLSSIIAGIVALFERPYRIGDWVRIGEAYGEVKSLGLRTLEMVTPDDTLVTIPHEKIWDTPIYDMNVGQTDQLQCVIDFFVHPDHDGQAAQQALWDVAATSPYLNLHKEITVISLGLPWGLRHRIRAYPTRAREQFQFISDLTTRGYAALIELGAEPIVHSEPAPQDVANV